MMLGFGPEEWQTIWLSIRIACWATLASLPFGIWVGFILARKQGIGAQVLNILTLLPLVLPPVVTGYILLWSFAPIGPLGAVLEALGISLAFRWTGAALAAAIMAFPLMVRAIRLSVEAIDLELEDAAATLGANPIWVFITVTLPLALPGILAGCVLGFAKALGEFGATITFVANIPGETRTIPSAIYAFLQIPGAESAAIRLVFVSIVIAIFAVICSEVIARSLAQKARGR